MGAQALVLALDDVLILRKLLGQIRDLLAEEGADPEDHQKRRQHDGCHRRDASQAEIAEKTHGRRKHEGQQDRDRERHQNLLGEIERRNDRQRRKDGQRAGNHDLRARRGAAGP
jgi:hypothetical protein